MIRSRILLSALPVLLVGCFSSDSGNPIVSQTFHHKYGFDVTAQEWNERAQDGQIISVLKDGVKVSRSYENGVLHGPTTYSFPHSTVIEKTEIYDQGTLLKEIVHDVAGIPAREDVYEFGDKTIITLWDAKGAPISIEEYEGDRLTEGKYYNPSHDLEGQVARGMGDRVKRDREGLLILRDRIEGGQIASRTSFHPNGQLHTVSRYKDAQLHGEQQKFTASGKPLMTLHWENGALHGQKVVYRNGTKVAEIPYVHGKKNGIETHCDDLGNLTAEIEWKNDKKHGVTKLHSEEGTEQEWFYKGQAMSLEKYERLTSRDQLIADLSVQ